METKIVKIDPEITDHPAIAEAAAIIDGGGLVAFPTETVYGIGCRAGAESLERLNSIKGRDPGKYYTLHIGDKGQVRRYVPNMGIRAAKLVEKAWPGPLTVVFELGWRDSQSQSEALGAELFGSLYRDGSIGIRCPDNSVASELLVKARSAVVAPSANPAGGTPATSAAEVISAFSGKVEMVLDGGQCKHNKSSTVVKVDKGRLNVLREGVYRKGELESMSRIQFLFVCTGNSCRSPMAEGLFRKYLAEKLECDVDRLEEMGYKVLSAGTMEMSGLPASAGALSACKPRGVDLRAHASRSLSRELLEESDFIFTMESAHRRRVVAIDPSAEGRCELLGGSEDIADPMGQPQQYYDSCADLIEGFVKKRIGELLI